MGEHTPTPWTYRPQKFDDWGFIRGPDGSLAAVARNSKSRDDFDEHRRAGTDPYGANAALIVKAVNQYEAHEAVALVALELVTECAGYIPPSLGVLEKLCTALNDVAKAKTASTPDLHGEGG